MHTILYGRKSGRRSPCSSLRKGSVLFGEVAMVLLLRCVVGDVTLWVGVLCSYPLGGSNAVPSLSSMRSPDIEALPTQNRGRERAGLLQVLGLGILCRRQGRCARLSQCGGQRDGDQSDTRLSSSSLLSGCQLKPFCVLLRKRLRHGAHVYSTPWRKRF